MIKAETFCHVQNFHELYFFSEKSDSDLYNHTGDIRNPAITVHSVYRGSYIFLLTNSMNYNSTSDISKCMHYVLFELPFLGRLGSAVGKDDVHRNAR